VTLRNVGADRRTSSGRQTHRNREAFGDWISVRLTTVRALNQPGRPSRSGLRGLWRRALASAAAASEAACYLVTRSKNARLWSVLIDQFTGTVWKPLRSTKSFSL
jgi:hypothetical protein